MNRERQAIETIRAVVQEIREGGRPDMIDAHEALAALAVLTAALGRAEQAEKAAEAARVLHATPKIIEPGKQLRLISLCYFDGELDALIDALALASGGETG